MLTLKRRWYLCNVSFSAWYKSFSIIAEDSFNPVFKIAAILDPYWTGRAQKMAFLWLSERYGRFSVEGFGDTP